MPDRIFEHASRGEQLGLTTEGRAAHLAAIQFAAERSYDGGRVPLRRAAVLGHDSENHRENDEGVESPPSAGGLT